MVQNDSSMTVFFKKKRCVLCTKLKFLLKISYYNSSEVGNSMTTHDSTHLLLAQTCGKPSRARKIYDN